MVRRSSKLELIACARLLSTPGSERNTGTLTFINVGPSALSLAHNDGSRDSDPVVWGHTSIATEMRCPPYVRYSPDSDQIADASTRR